MVQNKTYTKEELLNLYNEPLSKLLEISHKITSENFDNTVEACSILSAKTGACSENCKYCSQSKHNHAEIECHPLLDIETVKKSCVKCKKKWCNSFLYCYIRKSADRYRFQEDFRNDKRSCIYQWASLLRFSRAFVRRAD